MGISAGRRGVILTERSLTIGRWEAARFSVLVYTKAYSCLKCRLTRNGESCARYKTGTLAHAHERGWCCRLMKENSTDPGDSYAVSRTGRLRQGRVIRQRKIRAMQR